VRKTTKTSKAKKTVKRVRKRQKMQPENPVGADLLQKHYNHTNESAPDSIESWDAQSNNPPPKSPHSHPSFLICTVGMAPACMSRHCRAIRAELRTNWTHRMVTPSIRRRFRRHHRHRTRGERRTSAVTGAADWLASSGSHLCLSNCSGQGLRSPLYTRIYTSF
jgi:hypothetical protein